MMMAATNGCVATGSAATVYAETSGGDLSNSFTNPTVLPSGTDSVFGSVDESLDRTDHFIISNLMPGSTGEFEFSALVSDPTSGPVQFIFTNSSGQSLGFGSRGFGDTNPSAIGFTVPASGNVRISVEQTGTSESGAPASTWQVSTNSVVPEPSVSALAALGALLAMRRKRN